MEAIPFVFGLVVGAALGLMGYRYWLKRDPAGLEDWAAQIREAKRRARDQLGG